MAAKADDIQDFNQQPAAVPAQSKESFRDRQLRASGIPEAAQRSVMKRVFNHSEKQGKPLDPDNQFSPRVVEQEVNRYERGTFSKDWRLDDTADDMVMRYIDLQRKPMYYRLKNGRSQEFVRIRHREPADHLDRNGRAMKYASPVGSGSFLWLPEKVIKAHEQGQTYETLIICEGEKKADRLCLEEGTYAVGISGIHQLASKDAGLHGEFATLIKASAVKKVVFLLDSDCFDLATQFNVKESADKRPRQFYYAVRNYRDHFRQLRSSNIDVELYFAHTLKVQDGAKGIDDLLEALHGNERRMLLLELAEHLEKKEGEGKYLAMHRITTSTDTALMEIFRLHRIEAFVGRYREELADRGGLFRFERTEWRICDKDEDNPEGFELAQPLPEDDQFWRYQHTSQGTKLKYDFLNGYRFLKEHGGFGRLRLKNGPEPFQIVRVDGKIVEHLEQNKLCEVSDFVIDFCRTALRKPDIINMIYEGAERYFGEPALRKMDYIQIQPMEPQADCEFFYFAEGYWKVSAHGVEQHKYASLPGMVWRHQVLNHISEPRPIADFIKVTKDEKADKWHLHISERAAECDFVKFMLNTCRLRWQEYCTLDEEGSRVIDPERYTAEIQAKEADMFISKMTAIGYLLHTYRSQANSRAVIAMDAKLSEIGASNGRSGKSLLGKALEQMRKVVYIEGKDRGLEQNGFIWGEVDDKTNIVWLDDIEASFRFEWLFNRIAGRMTVNRKNKQAFTLPEDKSPRFYLTTNHALMGDSDSYRARQVLIGFADYYSANYQPHHDFEGRKFWQDWTAADQQWELFYNFMASCVQLHLSVLAANGTGIIQGDNEELVYRRLKQEVGDEFLTWFQEYFAPDGDKMNVKIDRTEAFESCRKSSKILESLGKKHFFDKLKKSVKLMGYRLNPEKNGDQIRSNGKEFIVVATEKYVPTVEAEQSHEPAVNF